MHHLALWIPTFRTYHPRSESDLHRFTQIDIRWHGSDCSLSLQLCSMQHLFRNPHPTKRKFCGNLDRPKVFDIFTNYRLRKEKSAAAARDRTRRRGGGGLEPNGRHFNSGDPPAPQIFAACPRPRVLLKSAGAHIRERNLRLDPRRRFIGRIKFPEIARCIQNRPPIKSEIFRYPQARPCILPRPCPRGGCAFPRSTPVQSVINAIRHGVFAEHFKSQCCCFSGLVGVYFILILGNIQCRFF